MGNYERGIYEPSDEVRVFDGSEEEDVEGSRLPLLIVLALIVLFAFGGVVYFAYSQGVARGRGETPILTAAGGPEKVAPQNPGGARAPYQGFKIYEQPAPPDDSADAATPPPPAPAKVAAAAEAPPPKAQAPAKPVEAAAAKPVEKAAEKPVEKPAEKPVVAAAKPAPKPASPAIATGAPRALASALPGAATASAPAPAAAAPTATPATGSATGSYVLQIGAYKSQADADAAWNTYKARHAALLSGLSQNVQQADLGEKGTWYRLRITGFSDKDVASATCDRLKADGGACFLGK